MHGDNLFEAQVLDEDHSEVAEPTEWLKSLPIDEQMTKVKHFIRTLEGEYDAVTDGTERARLSVFLSAARHYLAELEKSPHPLPSFRR